MTTHDIELPRLPPTDLSIDINSHSMKAMESFSVWTEAQMKSYASAAIEADRKRRGEPVGYFQNVNSLFPDAEPLYEQVAGEHVGDPDVFPLYAAPQSAEPENKERVGWRYRIKSNEKWTLTDTKPTGIPVGGEIQEVWAENAEPVAAEFPVKGKLHGPIGWIANTTNPEPVNSDRRMLLELMEAFDIETWQCPSCGHTEDTATMDSAYMLRDYLKDATFDKPVKVPSDSDLLALIREHAFRQYEFDDLLAFARALLARYGSTKDEAIKQQRKI